MPFWASDTSILTNIVQKEPYCMASKKNLEEKVAKIKNRFAF